MRKHLMFQRRFVTNALLTGAWQTRPTPACAPTPWPLPQRTSHAVLARPTGIGPFVATGMAY